MAEPRLKIPGESTTKPSFASPQIQTAADVGLSQKVAGIAPPQTGAGPLAAPPGPPKEPLPGLPPPNPERGQPTPSNPNAPGFAPTTSSRTPDQTTGGTGTLGGPKPGAGPVTASATVPTVTGAPPGVPNTAAMPSNTAGAATPALPATTPEPVLPPPKALEGANAAQNEWIQAQNENAKKLYEAALAYSGGPNSELEANQRAAIENKRGATNARGGAGTIESSLFQGDLGRISQRLATANSASYIKYQKAISDANDALQKARTAFERAGEQERKEIAEAKERREATEAMNRASAPAAAPAPPPMNVAPNPLPTPDAYGWVHTPTGSYRIGGKR